MYLFNNLRAAVSTNSLTARCLRSGGILAFGSVAENLARFIRNIVLTRLLAPEAFGLMATLLAAVATIETFTEVGFRQSVIQNRKGAEEKFLTTIWVFSCARSFFLYVAAFILAPYFSSFYQISSPEVLRVGCVAILLNGIISPGVYVLEKEMRFKRWVILMQGVGVAGVLITLLSAHFLLNVWALVIGYLAELLLRAILSFVLCPFKPRLRIDRESAFEIMHFSRSLFGLPILMIIFYQIDIFFIGKLLSLDILGIYAITKGLAEMPNTLAAKIVHPVMLPMLSLHQENREKVRSAMLVIIKSATLFFMPLFIFIMVFSKPILLLAYGPRYSYLASTLALICAGVFFLLLSGLNMLVFMALGKPHLQRNAALVRTLLLFAMIYPGIIYFGVNGAALSILISVICSLGIQLIYLVNLLKLDICDYIKSMTTGFLTSIIVVVPGMAIISLSPFEGLISVSLGIILCLAAWCIGFARLSIVEEKNFIT